jgi:hypothetical protein
MVYSYLFKAFLFTFSFIALLPLDFRRVELFGSVFESAGGVNIAVDSAHWRTFVGICAVLCNSKPYGTVCAEFGNVVPMENVNDHLQFLLTTECGISTLLEFIASHFYDFLCRRNVLNILPFPMIYEILSHGSLRPESDDSLSLQVHE